MKNRNVEFFNLSFLDLLSGALAAVIFLFIIVPKGDYTITDNPVMVTYDTLEQKFYGAMPDSLMGKQPGDTLLAIISGFEKRTEGIAGQPEQAEPQTPREVRPRTPRSPRETPEEKTEKTEEPKEEKSERQQPIVEPPKLVGSRPDVPCKLSIEMRWASKKDNVDLFVCKDGDCVFGGKRFREAIGFWDSGKSRTSIFSSDVRTNQEAVRQFDEIIPGTYEILAQYKDSSDPKTNLPIRLQVYTVNDEGVERGKEHYFKLDIHPTERAKIAVVTVGANGELDFKTLK